MSDANPGPRLVRLTRNDGAQEFVLKAEKVSRAISKSAFTKAIISAVGDIAGMDVNLDFENYTLSGRIENTDPDSYPNLQGIDTGSWGHATAKECALAQAARVWGPDFSSGFDTLHWGPRDIEVIITKLNTDENAAQRGTRKFTFTMEFTHANIYVGEE